MDQIKKSATALILVASFTLLTNAQTTNSASANNPYAPNPKSRTVKTTDSLSVPKVVFEPSNTATIETVATSAAPTKESENLNVTYFTSGTTFSNRYSIGPSDILDIYIKGQPLKQRFYTVSDDGTIDFALAGGKVFVASKSTTEVEVELKSKVTLLSNVDVRISIKERSSHAVEVTGAVALPGIVQLQRDSIPLFVLNASVMPRSDAKLVKITRVEHGNVIAQTLEMQNHSNFMVQPNDRLEYINEESSLVTGYFYIAGRAAVTGKHDISGSTTLLSIANSVSMPKDAAKRIKLRTRANDGSLRDTEFDLRSLRNGKVADVQITQGSIVEFID